MGNVPLSGCKSRHFTEDDRMSESKVLTPKEFAARMRMNLSTVYDLLERGEIPGRKVGGGWRIPVSYCEEIEGAR